MLIFYYNYNYVHIYVFIIIWYCYTLYNYMVCLVINVTQAFSGKYVDNFILQSPTSVVILI